jgi:hypothetical protein
MIAPLNFQPVNQQGMAVYLAIKYYTSLLSQLLDSRIKNSSIDNIRQASNARWIVRTMGSAGVFLGSI